MDTPSSESASIDSTECTRVRVAACSACTRVLPCSPVSPARPKRPSRLSHDVVGEISDAAEPMGLGASGGGRSEQQLSLLGEASHCCFGTVDELYCAGTGSEGAS
eukprot:3529834-Prymnesium_polylepis.1